MVAGMSTTATILIFLAATTLVCGEYFGPSHLPFDHSAEYASKYTNYQPHNYEYGYAVSDPHTGDHKSQWETKENGVVRGGYSLLEPDGTTRVVEYVADHDGFRAVVKKLGDSVHPTQVETHGVTHAVPQIISDPVAPLAPIVPQPIIKKPVIVEEAPKIYHSYDGHANNYQPIYQKTLATVPHAPGLAGLYYQQPQLGYQEEQLLPIQSDILPYPQAPGLYKSQYIAQPNYIQVQPSQQYVYPNYQDYHDGYETIHKPLTISFDQQQTHLAPWI